MSAPNSYLRNARPPFAILILEMRFGKRRPSPRSGWKYLMTGRMLRELHHDKSAPTSRRLENLLPGNAMKICSCYQCLFRAGRIYQLERHKLRLEWDCLCLSIDQSWLARKQATIQSFSLSAYTISRCRYQSMHLNLRGCLSPPTQLSATNTQSSPPSPGPLVLFLSSTAVITYAFPTKISIPVQITFRPSYVWQIFFRRISEVICMNLAKS